MRPSIARHKRTIIAISATIIAISISKIPPYGILVPPGGGLKIVMPWEYVADIKAFQYLSHKYVTLFIVPITSGMSFLALHIYLALAVYILTLAINGRSKKSHIFYCVLILLATIGTYDFYWLE